MSTTVTFEYEVHQAVQIKAIKELWPEKLGRIELCGYDWGGPLYRVSHWVNGAKVWTWLHPSEIEPVEKVDDKEPPPF